MYAVIQAGGKQHRVEPGKTVRVEKMEGAVGSKVQLKDVLLVAGGDSLLVGAPMVAKAKVNATVLAQDRRPKIRVFKTKRKKQYRRTHGHRQAFTDLRVDEIKV